MSKFFMSAAVVLLCCSLLSSFSQVRGQASKCKKLCLGKNVCYPKYSCKDSSCVQEYHCLTPPNPCINPCPIGSQCFAACIAGWDPSPCKDVVCRAGYNCNDTVLNCDQTTQTCNPPPVCQPI